MSAAVGFVDHLDAEVRELRDRMADGSYQFGDQDLSFMPVIAGESTHFLPFKELLETINRTHRQGLGTDT
ncbi:MAG: hypothetical protein WAN46_02125 [Gammaproteobacteria bacterium]